MPSFVFHLTAHLVFIHVVAPRTHLAHYSLGPSLSTIPSDASHYLGELLLLALAQGDLVRTRSSFEATALGQESRNFRSKIIRLLLLSLCYSFLLIIRFLVGAKESIFGLWRFFGDLKKTDFGSLTFKHSLSSFSLFGDVCLFGVIGAWSRC